MSTIIMSKCWPLPMSTSQKIVLISLADNANDDGWCWPGLEKICMRSCLSERAVQTAFKALEGMGVLVRQHRYKRSTVYRVVPGRFQPLNTAKAAPPAANNEPDEAPDSGPENPPELPPEIPEDDPDLTRSSCTAGNAGQEFLPADDCILTRSSLHSDPQQLRAEPSVEPPIGTASPAREPAHTHVHTREGPGPVSDDVDAGRVQVDFSVPDWVPIAPWLNYIHARSQQGLPTTPGAKAELQRQLRELVDQGQNAEAVLREALACGWKRLYPLRLQGSASSPSDQQAEIEAIKARQRQREQEEAQYAS